MPSLTTRRTHHAFAAEVHVPLAGGGVLSLSIEDAERMDSMCVIDDPYNGLVYYAGELDLAPGFDIQGEIDRAKAANAASLARAWRRSRRFGRWIMLKNLLRPWTDKPEPQSYSYSGSYGGIPARVTNLRKQSTPTATGASYGRGTSSGRT